MIDQRSEVTSDTVKNIVGVRRQRMCASQLDESLSIREAGDNPSCARCTSVEVQEDVVASPVFDIRGSTTASGNR